MIRPILVLLVCAHTSFADFAGLPDNVKANLSAIKKYPKASSILLWVKDLHIQQESGAQIYERHEFRYLPDEAARDLWGDPHIAYVEGRQTVEVLAARAYTDDGRTIDATPNAFNPITPDALDHAPDFSDFKQLVVTLLGLENGSIAELHYTLTTSEPLFPWLWGRAYFHEEVPTIARELSVTLPDGQSLNYKAENVAPELLITNSTYTWRQSEQPGYLAEDLQGHRELLPNVAFTTASEWPEVANEFKDRVTASSDDVILPASLNKKLLGTVESENRLDSIKAWMRERFNEIKFDHPDFQLTLRPASRVLETGYGNSVELAVLVAKLCESSSISVHSVAWFAIEPPVPYLFELTGGLLFIKNDGETIETHPLLPRNEFPRTEIADATFLYLDEKEGINARRPAVSDDLEFRVNLNIDALDSDTLHGAGMLVAQSWQTPYESLRRDAKDYLQSLLSLDGVTIENVQIKRLSQDYSVVAFAFTCPALDTVDGHHVLNATALDLSQFAGNPNFSLERKEFPHYVKLPGEISVHLETPVPDGWTVTQQPTAISRAWKDGSGTRTVEMKDGRVIVDEKLVLGDVWIPPQDWSEFHSFLIETGDRPNNVIVFSEKPN